MLASRICLRTIPRREGSGLREEQIIAGSTDEVEALGESPAADQALEGSDLEVDLGDGGIQTN